MYSFTDKNQMPLKDADYPILSDYPILIDDELKRYYTFSAIKPPLLELTPETILAEVYRTILAEVYRIDFKKLETLGKEEAKKRAAIIAYANGKIFNHPQSNQYINQLNAKEKRELDRIIDKAKSLHQRLEFDVLNTRITTDPVADVTIEERIKKFNEYMQNKKWSRVGPERTVAGNTALSSLEFKNWLTYQKPFKDLIDFKLKTTDPAVNTRIANLLQKIYTATDDNWLDSMQTEATSASENIGPVEKEIISNIFKISSDYKKFHTYNKNKDFDIPLNISFQSNDIKCQVFNDWNKYATQNQEQKAPISIIMGTDNKTIFLDDGGSEKTIKITDHQSLETLAALPENAIFQMSEMPLNLIHVFNKHKVPIPPSIPSTITVYLKPPKEMMAVFDGEKVIDEEIFNNYKGSSFLYNNSLYYLNRDEEGYFMEESVKFDNPQQTESFKRMLKDHYHLPSDDDGIIMREKDYIHVLNIVDAFEGKFDPSMNDLKSNTWQLENEQFDAIDRLQKKLLDIKKWAPTNRTMHEIPFTTWRGPWDPHAVLVNDINFVAVNSIENPLPLDMQRPSIIRKLPLSKLAICSQFKIGSDDLWDEKINDLIKNKSDNSRTFLVKMEGDNNDYVFYYPEYPEENYKLLDEKTETVYRTKTLTLRSDEVKALNNLRKDKFMSPDVLERASQDLFRRLRECDTGFQDEFYIYDSKSNETRKICSLLSKEEAKQFRDLGSHPTVVSKPKIILSQNTFHTLKQDHPNLTGEKVKPADYKKESIHYVPTPVKNILKKIEKVHDPANDKGITLKQIASTGLLESISKKNNSAEKEFYGSLAGVIDLDATFQRIADEIISKFGPIDKKTPPGVKAIYNLCFENKQQSLNKRQSQKERLSSILHLAGMKQGDFLKNIFLREQRTKDFYNNIEDFIVLKKGADLEKAIQVITSPDAFVPSQDKHFVFDKVIDSIKGENEGEVNKKREIMKIWKDKLLRRALFNLGFSSTKNDFSPKEAKQLSDELSHIVYSYNDGAIPLFDGLPKTGLQNNCETFLKYLLIGTPFSSDLLDTRLAKAMFIEKDPTLLQAFRETIQRIFKTMFNGIEKLQAQGLLNENQEKQLDMQIANILSIYTFFDPHKKVEDEILQIPRKVDNEWKLVDFEIHPIELKYDEKSKPLFTKADGTHLDENYPVYSYVLKPVSIPVKKVTSYLLFMGTPPDAGQGNYYALLSDFRLKEEDPKKGRTVYSVGETMYLANRKLIREQLKSLDIENVIVAGQSLGAAVGNYFVLDNPEKCEVAYLLNPPAFEPETLNNGPDNRPWAWQNYKGEKKDKLLVLVQERDLVDKFQIGQWDKDTTLLKLFRPDPLTVPLAGHYIAHLAAFSNVDNMVVVRGNAERDNEKRSQATIPLKIKSYFLDDAQTNRVVKALEAKKREVEKIGQKQAQTHKKI